MNAGIAIFISDTANFRVSKVIWDRERHYMIKKGSALQNRIILNMYASNYRTNYVRQKLNCKKK